MIKLECILVPTDFSDYSQQAIVYACELAKRFGAKLQLLHVVPPPALPMPYVAPVSEEMLHLDEAAERELDAWKVPALEQMAQVERVVRTGVPFVEIVRHAKDNDVDLIVIGTHGRTGLAHALLGSVAEKVVRKATCPVLTVRPEGHQFAMP
jgi:nucleotide-binding universal stress UspA family protein